jgi:large subunit ribosomal protein L30
MSFLKVTRTKSVLGVAQSMKRVVVDGLGLRKIGAVRTYKDNNCIRGMVNKVSHLVKCEIVDEKVK